jgi:hypothetical protein
MTKQILKLHEDDCGKLKEMKTLTNWVPEVYSQANVVSWVMEANRLADVAVGCASCPQFGGNSLRVSRLAEHLHRD